MSNPGITSGLKHQTIENSCSDADPLITYSGRAGCSLAAGRAWESNQGVITCPSLFLKVPRSPGLLYKQALTDWSSKDSGTFRSFMLVVTTLWGKQQAGLGPESSPVPRLRALTLYHHSGSLPGDLSHHLLGNLLPPPFHLPCSPSSKKSTSQSLLLHPASVPNVC